MAKIQRALLSVSDKSGLSPEHIESHGSFENYKKAKLRLVKQLAKSNKPTTLSIASIDENKHGYSFLVSPVAKNISFSLKDAKILEETEEKSVIDYKGEIITIPLPGRFNIRNTLSALILAEENGIPLSVAKEGIEKLHLIRGRVERVQCGQPFTVIVDYAHTDDSLRKLYETFKNSRKIAVLGSTGGGRDSWKRPVLGAIADEYCSKIIITNEDPYDEDPMNIIKDVARGVTNHTPTIIINRREAIAHALREAKPLDVVLITGKGTDPYIMGPNGTKEAWDDARVVREELTKLGYEK
jgi:UDP-N-acetylmuramoyl-L-alanyl-D-glutamate--2,6-diaminopimelate ligase